MQGGPSRALCPSVTQPGLTKSILQTHGGRKRLKGALPLFWPWEHMSKTLFQPLQKASSIASQISGVKTVTVASARPACEWSKEEMHGDSSVGNHDFADTLPFFRASAQPTCKDLNAGNCGWVATWRYGLIKVGSLVRKCLRDYGKKDSTLKCSVILIRDSWSLWKLQREWAAFQVKPVPTHRWTGGAAVGKQAMDTACREKWATALPGVKKASLSSL